MALKKIKQVKDSSWTYTLMATTESDDPKWVHIDNHLTKNASVLVPLSSLAELLSGKPD